MRAIKNESKHYLETKILGAYETADIVWQSDSKGDYHRTFDDTFILTNEDNHTVERVMDIEGRIFNIHSVFPIEFDATPTEKLLSVIDLVEK